MTVSKNQNPEQIARDEIDKRLTEAGWIVQDKKAINFNAGQGIAVREYQTDVGPADYVLFVDKKAVSVIEAKPEDWGHKITTVEDQSAGYAAAKLKWVNNKEPLPFVYESTGVVTRFTDGRDPKPRSREVFTFHRPETMAEWLSKPASLRARLQTIPPLVHTGLRDCQIKAIENLESSFKQDRPRALVQMATGSGKTYTAITSVYRLLKHADAKRILFLVDTKNLGEQAEQEFMSYLPNDDNRKFTELYNVQRLKSSFVAKDSQVCISTIQRMYSLLKDEPLDEAAEEANPAELLVKGKRPLPVVYNKKIPPEFFDFIIIDECHRSIYNLWRQVIEYFDAYLIGLDTAYKFTREGLRRASQPGCPAYEAAEILLKGPEVPLPEGHFFSDKDGFKRHHVRIRWWDPEAVTYRSAALGMDGDEATLPDLPVPTDYHYEEEKPVFFGHYWLSGIPTLSNHRAACLDFSIAKGGFLTAYRWSGEKVLSQSNIVYVAPNQLGQAAS